MRERLVELLKSKSCWNNDCPEGGCEKCDYIAVMNDDAEHIADYLIANGVIVPPMNIGQQCFILGYGFGKCKECVMECKVSCVTQKKNGSFAIRISQTKYSATHNFTPDDIGKTVFLNREDAEKALKGDVGK